MNKWQLTGVIIDGPSYQQDSEVPTTQLMIFTLKNTEKNRDGRKRAIWVECTWPAPAEEIRRLFRSRALVKVEGYGFHRPIIREGQKDHSLALIVEKGEYLRDGAEVPVQR